MVKKLSAVLVIGAIVFYLAMTKSNIEESDTAQVNTQELISSTEPAINLSPENIEEIKTKFKNIGLNVENIGASKLPQMFEVLTDQGLFYSSLDGSYLIQGKLYHINEQGNVDSLTENSLAQIRVKGLANFADNMVVFPAENEKFEITVFTDLTCGYCRKMHNQMAGFNDLGITVRYLAFPRGGLNSKGSNDLQNVWCSENNSEALTAAFNGAEIDKATCSNSTIGEQYDFGRQIGVTGTPAIILDDGFMIPGYKSPAQMQQILKSYQEISAS